MAAPAQSLELARQEGENFRSVILASTEEGGLDVSAQDMGPTVRALHDDGDYEFGIRIAPEHLAAFAFALVREHYQGDLDAVAKLRAIADRDGLPTNFWTWS